jgi:hypothetical protein
MMERRRIRSSKSEAGIALLISIFVLLLISVVAIALIVSSGTESALAGNYRSSTDVYYAAMAGLEEARARLRPQGPISFKNTDAGFLTAAGNPMSPCSPIYVVNPLGGEAVTPWDTNSTYGDKEFNQEFAGICGLPNPSPSTMSIWNRSPLNGLAFPGPLYKWVRINGVTEQSLKLDVVPYDSTANDAVPIYYDGALNNSSSGSQVLEVTALAVLPNGSQKLVQYLVAPSPITLPPFLAAMTLAGSTASTVVSYTAPSSNTAFWVKGIDQDCSGSATGPKFPAIGVFNNNDVSVVTGGIPAGAIRNTNYPGTSGSPDVAMIYSIFPSAMVTPAGLDAVVQSIIQSADATVPTTSVSAEQTFLSNLVSSGTMSATSPVTVAVNGDLDLTGWHNTGYGLLLVTGTLTYDPDASWYGIVMVVGQGQVTGSKGGTGEIDGAMLVARTRDSSGVLLAGPNLGNSSVNFNAGASMGGNGIRYSNCWIQKSQPTSGYRILSFHEISQ